MGGPKINSTQESTATMLDAYSKYLPGLIQAQTKEYLPTEQARIDAAKFIQPQDNQLQLDTLKNFGQAFATEGQKIDSSNRMAAAQSDADVLGGPGQQLAKNSLELSKTADPEYYATRAKLGEGVAKLLDSFGDYGSLSGGEAATAERAINQNGGNNNNTSALNTIRRAANMGDALNSKRASISNALNVATGAAPVMKSGFDVVGTALGRTGGVNYGLGRFGDMSDVTSTAGQIGGNFLNQVGAANAQSNQLSANKATVFDNVMKGIGTVGSAVSGL